MEFKRMLRVSILGPVSTTYPDEEAGQFMNLRRMLLEAGKLVKMGIDPHVPGLCVIWHMVMPMPRETWMLLMQNEIARSDACYRMPGPSKGADVEIEFAEEAHKPVFYDLESLGEWARAQRIILRQEDLSDSLPTFDSEIVQANAPGMGSLESQQQTKDDFDRRRRKGKHESSNTST